MDKPNYCSRYHQHCRMCGREISIGETMWRFNYQRPDGSYAREVQCRPACTGVVPDDAKQRKEYYLYSQRDRFLDSGRFYPSGSDTPREWRSSKWKPRYEEPDTQGALRFPCPTCGSVRLFPVEEWVQGREAHRVYGCYDCGTPVHIHSRMDENRQLHINIRARKDLIVKNAAWNPTLMTMQQFRSELIAGMFWDDYEPKGRRNA